MGQQRSIVLNIKNVVKLPDGIKRKIVLIGLSVFFISAGVNHFTNTAFYLRIMPTFLPFHLESVYLSGIFEIVGGVGVLIHRFRKIAGWGLFALLIAVYPANIYMALAPDIFSDIPVVWLYFRLVLQFLFFYWAIRVTREDYN